MPLFIQTSHRGLVAAILQDYPGVLKDEQVNKRVLGREIVYTFGPLREPRSEFEAFLAKLDPLWGQSVTYITELPPT